MELRKWNRVKRTWAGDGVVSARTKETAENSAAQRKTLVCIMAEIFSMRDTRVNGS